MATRGIPARMKRVEEEMAALSRTCRALMKRSREVWSELIKAHHRLMSLERWRNKGGGR